MGNKFTDGYKRYDPKREGYGSAEEWQQRFYERMNFDEAKEYISSRELDPWQILGVSQKDSLETIKKCFRKLIKEWHPDHNAHRLLEAEEMSKKLIAAYTYITEN